MKRLRDVGVLLALVLLVSACGGTTTSADGSPEHGQAVPPLTGSVSTVAGGQFDLASIEGQDTMLWFWAPW